MILKSCNKCGNLIPYGATYCNRCRPIVEAAREARRVESNRKSNRAYNERRDPKYVRFYNSKEWRMLSARYAQDKGYKCESKDCNKIATEVHHKIPIQTPKGWELRLDYDNLELVCKDCHNKRHNRFQKRRKKP